MQQLSSPAQLAQLTLQARQQLTGQRPLLLAIDGRSGAGKTSLAGRLADLLRAEDLPVSLFHLEDLYQGWESLASTARTWQALAQAIVQGQAHLGPQLPHWYGWDWANSRPTGPHPFTAAQQAAAGVLIAEGVGALTGPSDLSVWVELDDSLRKQRALARDGETYRPYWDIWAAQEEDLLASYRLAYTQAHYRYHQATLSKTD